jgi:hypothetical protein
MIVIREACRSDAAGIGRVRVDTWRSTYGGIVPEEHLANLSYGKAEQAAERRLGDSQSGYFALAMHGFG